MIHKTLCKFGNSITPFFLNCMSSLNTFYTAGPAALFPTFEMHLRTALDEQLGSISHRSSAFKKIYQHTDEQLRTLMGIPAESAIMFTGSASEVWERILLNLVELESFHLVNGSFSEKFYQYAQALGKFPHELRKPMGEGFAYNEPEIPDFVEVICVTQNETSAGVQMREADIHRLKRSHGKKLIAVDMVSSAPIPDLDMQLIDTAFFSVQKAFGLPAGLGVWIANEACLEKAQQMKQKEGISIGAHHDLPTLWKQSKSYQTPATPNVLLIYLLGKIAEDMNKIGIDVLRKEAHLKAKMIYNHLEDSALMNPAVAKEEHRSVTVAVADTVIDSAILIDRMKQQKRIIGAGYGAKKERQIRIASFPAVSVEQVEELLDALKQMEP